MRMRDAAPFASVLNLFNGPAVSVLTSSDRAFLTALYRLQLDRRGGRHRAITMRELVAAMTASGTEQP